MPARGTLATSLAFDKVAIKLRAEQVYLFCRDVATKSSVVNLKEGVGEACSITGDELALQTNNRDSA